MHIPDGFLSTPVWMSLDAAAVPAIGYLARRAQRELEESTVPLLGVMGAFVFAAQMINFPVGVGTSGHLVGAALLAILLGPSAAVVVMTAILAIQALVFQDGGVLALGANVLNMALAGVLAGYVPYRLWGSGRWRNAAVFLSGAFSVFTAALLALGELRMSAIAIPVPVLAISLGLFAVTAALEGAITLAVVRGIEALHPGFVRRPSARSSSVLALAGISVFLAAVGFLFASTNPDGLARLAEDLGIAERARAVMAAPLADYRVAFLEWSWPAKAAAGLSGLLLIYALCAAFGRLASRQRSA
jgi:cobalt/nickel transport system permease protein